MAARATLGSAWLRAFIADRGKEIFIVEGISVVG
jgi:hypothetical protein